MGLRELKKMRTAEAISDTAVELFLRDGFANVSLADVASAAEVAKKTVFNYFPAKEDLVLFQIRDHVDEPSRVVRSRAAGESPVQALRRSFLAGLRAEDPITGLADGAQFIAVQSMVMSTPSLKLRLLEMWMRTEAGLAEALATTMHRPADALDPNLLAGQVVSIQRTLIVRNLARVMAGARPADVLPECLAEAERAFDLVTSGAERFVAGELAQLDPA